ncbi:septal ring lytic transglycosylase RlpA family protein [Curvibacter lanceolatus]|uniref:septal ring lytic transglycosylase RlpA family protein n=1 Tax=Curvibacter lanceolatus TaxID=86182 RepID=UPI000382B349|nr:septal ring lytic transglycosylase RlpA family protein [Curvibacter lanceolatus]
MRRLQRAEPMGVPGWLRGLTLVVALVAHPLSAWAAQPGFAGVELPLATRLEAAGSSSEEEPDEPPGDPLSTLMAPDEVYFERGGASWYGIELHRRRTASGERFNMNAMTAAHRTLPFGSRVCVRNLNNGKEVLVRINDRGPHTMGRIIDVSRAAAIALDLMGVGIKEVALSLPVVTGLPCGN